MEKTAVNLYGVDLFNENILPPQRGALSNNFIVSPFSVLNARDGFWQERKNLWLSIGIKSEVSRESVWNKGNEEVRAVDYNYEGGKDAWGGDGVSVFDPVLCELAYVWFTKSSDIVLDPFAGGSVRGIVSQHLGRKYYGIELRQEQVDANIKQANDIILRNENYPVWVCGDSTQELQNAPECDFIFTCPPYGNLEKYSDDPRDISTMEYHTFIAAYKRIIMRACAKLKKNRFVCIVVGDFRDEKGNYRNFVADTVYAFKEQGLYLYNDAILITPIGSLPVRVGRQFKAGRKLGKTHQNILVFVKGDGKAAAKRLNE